MFILASKRFMVKNVALLTGSGLFLRVVSMAFQVVLSQRIGPQGLGLVQLVLAVGSLAMTVATSGVRTAAMVLAAQEFGRGRLGDIRAAMNRCLAYGLTVSSAAALGLFFLADPLARGWVGQPETAASLRVLAAMLPCGCLCGVFAGYFTACGKLRPLVGTDIAERFFSIAATLALLSWAGQDKGKLCIAIVGGSGAGSLLQLLLLWRRYGKERLGPPAKGLSMGPRLLRLCVPLALNDYLRSGLSTLEQLLIPRGLAAHSSRQAGLGAYGTITGMVFPVMMFPAAILYALAEILVPELSRCLARREQRCIRHLTRRALELGLGFAAAVSCTLYCLGPPLGQLLYHSDQAGHYLRQFAPAVLFLYLDAITDGLSRGLGQQVHSVRYNTITNFMDVVLLYLLLPRLGIPGYLLTFVLTHLVNLFLSLNRLLRFTGCSLPLRPFVRLLGALALCFTGAGLLPDQPWSWVLAAGFCLAVMLWLGHTAGAGSVFLPTPGPRSGAAAPNGPPGSKASSSGCPGRRGQNKNACG